MASAAQIRANRANAQSSTGPRSEAGKEVTRFNALKHGLAAEKLVIRGENPENLEALREQLRADYAPATEAECMLVEEIAQCWWRLQRARAQENRFINVSMTFGKPYNPDDLGPILRYMTSVERGWHRAITQLRTAQNDRFKRDLAAGNPQRAEPEKVMAVGSVPQFEDAPQPQAETNHEIAAVSANDIQEQQPQQRTSATPIGSVPKISSQPAPTRPPGLHPAILSTHPFRLNMDFVRRKLEEDIRRVEAELAEPESGA